MCRHTPILKSEMFLEDNFVSHSGGPNEQFGTNEKLSCGCKVIKIGCCGIGET